MLFDAFREIIPNRLPCLDHGGLPCLNTSMKLYPPPATFRTRSGAVSRGGRHLISLKGEFEPRLLSRISAFAEAFGLTMTFGRAAAADTLITIDAGRAGSQHRENYLLRCDGDDSGLYLQAKGAGIFYGLLTTAQILRQGGEQIRCFTIEDEPDFPHRGVMLDVSRCKVPTLETLFDLIDRLAALKYNQLQLYTEHTFAFVNHPRVWADASPLNAGDMVRIREYCEERYIELVPNLNSFGHFERWLRHPEYHRYAECPDGFEHPLTGQKMPYGSTLKPNRASVTLLRELYDEYLPLFDSPHFNIGGDEPWELGHGWSRQRCEQAGSTRVYLDFLGEIQKLVESRDRTMMFWSDIVLKDPACLKQLSGSAVAMNWGYEGNHPFRKECEQMAAARVPYYVCPGTSAWNSLTGRSGNVRANVANAARNGLRFDAIGYLVTDWGDHGHHQYLPLSYAGYLLGACHAWNHRGARNVDAADGINRLFFDAADAGTGEVLMRLGEALERVPSSIRNATVFNRLLFWPMNHEPGVVKSISPEQFANADDELRQIADALVALRPGVRAGPVRDELANAIRLARHGIHRLQLFRGERHDPAALREELAVGIGEHERLWLARNRPGGLQESADHLRRSLGAITDVPAKIHPAE